VGWLRRWVRRWLGIDEVISLLLALQASAPIVPVAVTVPKLLGCGHSSVQYSTSKRDGSTMCLACYRVSLGA
jgi:hypothetical protein